MAGFFLWCERLSAVAMLDHGNPLPPLCRMSRAGTGSGNLGRARCLTGGLRVVVSIKAILAAVGNCLIGDTGSE